MAALEELSEEECALVAILLDESGVDIAEFMWVDERNDDSLFRCYDYQYGWYRNKRKLQIDQAGRAVGKSLGIQLRAVAFSFSYPGEEMLLTAPELIHLNPVTKYVEDRIMATRLTRDMLDTRRGQRGIIKRPFEARFVNGSKIIGRIPQKDGRGVKGQHPKKLEMDEAQDYPDAGWIEIMETLKFDDEEATFRAHGVTRGVRDYFYKLTQPGSGWKTHRLTGMHRPDWSAEERKDKEEFYGGRNSPDYRRNILGLHGDATNPLFVLSRLMQCVDENESSVYNVSEYYQVRITDERLDESGLPISALIDPPNAHMRYERFWIGADIGMTNHPTEILVFAEDVEKRAKNNPKGQDPNMRLRLISRIHLERISAPNQRAVFSRLFEIYRPKVIAMDKTGLGLPVYQEVVEGEDRQLAKVIRGYNFSEKITIGFEESEENEYGETEYEPIEALVLEASSDKLRALVDTGQIMLPWDIELLKEFQGETYAVKRSSTNPYGRKVFSSSNSLHTLDAARMAALAYSLEHMERLDQIDSFEPVMDIFVGA